MKNVEPNRSLTMLFRDYKKIMDTIISCNSIEHCDVADNMIKHFMIKWKKTDYENSSTRFYKRAIEENNKKRESLKI